MLKIHRIGINIHGTGCIGWSGGRRRCISNGWGKRDCRSEGDSKRIGVCRRERKGLGGSNGRC